MKCPDCKSKQVDRIGDLEFIPESYPYDPDHYMCSECYRTYTVEEVKHMAKYDPLPVEILVDALQDTIHEKPKRSKRKVKAKRIKKY